MKKIFLLLSMFAATSAFSQLLDSTLSRYAQTITIEKAYLHLDKSAYTPGETIWFKAYIMDDIFPAEASKTLYVDWIAPDGSVLTHTVAPIVSGNTNGQFLIPETYKEGFVHVRAYTKWMLNFDTAFLYSRDIRILNTQKSTSPPVQIQPQIQFFPEGGDIIAGINNRIAFKATDQWGRPLSITGTIRSDQNEIADTLRVKHDGMGSFYLLPATGRTYTAQWKDEKGKLHSTPLPSTKTSGIGMQVALNGSKRVIAIEKTPSPNNAVQSMHLIGMMNGKKAFETSLNLSDKPVQKIVPTEGLPTGILLITLFDADWKPVAERITFVNNHDFSFKPELEVARWGLGVRKKNEVDLKLPANFQGATLSVSVTDLALETDSSENIYSHLLLSSEVRGKVFNPAYYFQTDDESRASDLDLVMLTNGWRRFNWNEIANGTLTKLAYARDTNYLSLSGQLIGVPKSMLTGKESIVLLLKEKDSAMKSLILGVDRNGRFDEPAITFFDTLTVFYSMKSKLFSSPEARFLPERLAAPNYVSFARNFAPYRTVWDTSGQAYHLNIASENSRLDAIKRGKVLDAVIIKTTTKTPMQVMDEKYATGLFRGGDGYQFDFVNDPSASSSISIFQFLQGRVAGLTISSGPEPTLSWRGGSPQLYLDEFPTDVSMVETIPVSQIAYVKVFRPPFFGTGSGGGSGGIVIYTKKGEDARNTGTGLSSNKVSVYTRIKEFYSPNYERTDPRSVENDLRTTIYWNPLVTVAPGSKSVRLSFFNNDISKAFRIVVEGMSVDGLLTHLEQVME